VAQSAVAWRPAPPISAGNGNRCAEGGEGQGAGAGGGGVGFTPGAKHRGEAVVNGTEDVRRGPRPPRGRTPDPLRYWRPPPSERGQGGRQGQGGPCRYRWAKSWRRGTRSEDTREAGVVAKAGAKARPDAPGGVLGGAALSRDAGTKRRRDSAPVTARSRSGGGRQKRQEVVCG
jgi:hypothetical protein